MLLQVRNVCTICTNPERLDCHHFHVVDKRVETVGRQGAVQSDLIFVGKEITSHARHMLILCASLLGICEKEGSTVQFSPTLEEILLRFHLSIWPVE